MKNLKASQRNMLMKEFGILLQPLYELARAPLPPSLEACRGAIAKVQAGDALWRSRVKEFTTFGAPDLFRRDQNFAISHVPEQCWLALNRILDDPTVQEDLDLLKERVGQEVETAWNEFRKHVGRVPIEWEPVVFEANTPLTSYYRIKDSIAFVEQRLDYFDRYLSPDFFELFLQFVSRTVSIRLVTTKIGVSNVAAVSKLAKEEFANYKLIRVTRDDIHDRNLRVDDQIFSLGPGVGGAGIALTNFGPSDSSPETHSLFDQIIAKGTIVS